LRDVLGSKRILAVVPARGGSKGVPLKNLHPLQGIPLIAHVGRVVRDVPAIDRALVSTDHPGIAAEAERAGLATPFTRPPEISGDLASDHQVLVHALTTVESLDGLTYDVVLMLQPTSPLRRAAHLNAVLEKLVNEGWDAVWTVSATDLKYHPLKQLAVGEGGAMSYFDPAGARIVARQQLQPVYHRNGVAYAFTRACLLEQETIMGARSAAVVLDEPMVSIDTLDDFRQAERELERRGGGS
jgi:CMP-N,N'-diacetyllegionaminic acid synthase